MGLCGTLEKIAGKHYIMGNKQEYSQQAMGNIAKEALNPPSEGGKP